MMATWKEIGTAQKMKTTMKVEEEVSINLAEKLLKLDLEDIEFIYHLIINSDFKGDEIEKATATLLKVRFIKANLKEEQQTKSRANNGIKIGK